MTKTQTISMTAAGPEAAAGTAQFLTPVVLGLQSLAVNGKQAHWNVRGTNFIAIHELLDTVVANAQGFADLAAERIVALGLPVDARLSTIADKTTATNVPAGFAQWQDVIAAVVTDMDVVIADVQSAIDGLDETDLTSQDVIAAVVTDMDAVIADVQAAIDGLDETDLTSQDVAIAIKAGLEKDRWFLSAHLAA